MGESIVEIEEIIADVVAYIAATQFEDTLEPSNEGLKAAHVLLSLQGVNEESVEYATIFGTIYALAVLGYFNFQVGVTE